MKFLSAIIRSLDWWNHRVLKVCKFLTIVLVGVIALDIFVGVFSRYVLNNALAWYEESAKYLMLWMVFTASPIVLKQGGHIALDVLPRSLAPRLQRVNYLIIYSIVIAFLGILIWQGSGLAWNARIQMPTSVPVSFLVVYAAIPFGAAIMLLVSLEFWFRALRGVFSPSDDDFPSRDWSPDSVSMS